MIISFFEEFPTPQVLKKISLIRFPTRIFLAAHSVAEFLKLKKSISSKYVLEVVYWPILQREEGYWVSPFSSKKALERIFLDVKDKKIPLLLDLEYPTTQNPTLYFTQFPFFFNNKNILSMLSSPSLWSAEYYASGPVTDSFLSFFGLHLNPKKYHSHVIKMFYHSLHHFDEQFFEKELRKNVKKWGNKFCVGMGTIACGIHGTEPLLLSKLLEKDLAIAKKVGVSEVVLFRLGGLNQKYLSVLKKFASK